jgi:hypothetical protein
MITPMMMYPIMTDWFILPAMVAAMKARSMIAPSWNINSDSEIIRHPVPEAADDYL